MNTIDSEIVDAIKCMVAYQVERARKRDPNWERALRNLVEELAQHRDDAKRPGNRRCAYERRTKR